MLPALAPPWLRDGVGQKVLYTFGAGADVLMNKLTEAVKMRIPTYGDASALPYLANDRLLIQGPNESSDAFAQRLKAAYDSWRIAGNARSVAEQIRGYLSPFTPTIRTVDRSGNWNTWTPDMDPAKVPPSVSHTGPFRWDSINGGMYSVITNIDRQTARWFDYWVVVYSQAPQNWATQDGLWSDPGTWGDGGAWDVKNLATGFFDGLRALVNQWQAQGLWCRGIIVVFAAENAIFDPTGTQGPDGTWGLWQKTFLGTNVVAARDPRAIYIDGTNTYNLQTPFLAARAPTDQLLPR